MATAKKTAPKPGTAVATRSNSAIVSVKEQMAAQLAKLQDKTAPATGNMIRVTQDKQFAMPDGTKTRDSLQLVIVDFVSRNRFWVEDYDKDNPTPPACCAIGDNPRTLIPLASSPERQSDECSSCPMNAFGTDKNGKGKACKNGRLLAVLPPDAGEDDELWLLDVSPTAIKGFDGYVNGVARTFSTPPIGVITTVSFNESTDYPSLVFGEPVVNENVAVHMARLEDATKQLNTEPDFSTYGQAPAKPAKPAARPAAKTAARQPAVARR